MLLLQAPEEHTGYFEAIVQGNDFYRYLNVIKSLPSRQWDKDRKVWTIALNDYDILKKECEDRRLLDIKQSPRLNELLIKYRDWCIGLEHLTKQEDCDLNGIDISSAKLPLMPHQKVALKFFLQRKTALNTSEMGTGKTYPALLTAMHLKSIGEIRNCLVVCIASVKYNWVREIEKCLHNVSYRVVEGSPEKRTEAYLAKAFFKIVNYEILRNDIESVLFNLQFDCIIVDEIHRIRTHKAKQTKALIKLAKNSSYRYGLTGTPVQNKLRDLHSIMKFIHPHIFGNWMVFDRRYITRGYFGEIAGYQRLSEVHNKLKTIMIRKLKSDVLKDLPPKVYNDLYIELSKEQRKFYNDVKRNLLESEIEDVEEKVKQANILANITFLREICDSCELIDPNVRKSEKLKELKKLVEEIVENGHKVVVFSQFRKMINIIARDLKLPAIILDGSVPTTGGVRDKLVNEFRVSEKKNVFLMTTAGGEGINLQCADYIIFMDLPFNPQQIAQIEDRLHRKGQEGTVNVIRLIAKDTVEDRVLEILKFKTQLFKEVVDGITQKPVGISQKELLKAV